MKPSMGLRWRPRHGTRNSACWFTWPSRPAKPASGARLPLCSSPPCKSRARETSGSRPSSCWRMSSSPPAGREAVAICQQLLSDDSLLGLSVAAEDGHRTVRADLLIGDRLRGIVQKEGRAVYAPFDKEAAALFDRGRKEKDSRCFFTCAAPTRRPESSPMRCSPWAPSTSRGAGSPRPSTRTNACKRWRLTTTGGFVALWRLAHVYEAKQLLVSSRDVYLDLLARFPQRTLLEEGLSATVGELAGTQLARPIYASIALEGPEPPTPLPLFRRWHWQPRDAAESVRHAGGRWGRTVA